MHRFTERIVPNIDLCCVEPFSQKDTFMSSDDASNCLFIIKVVSVYSDAITCVSLNICIIMSESDEIHITNNDELNEQSNSTQ